jgi:hypothetical protein
VLLAGAFAGGGEGVFVAVELLPVIRPPDVFARLDRFASVRALGVAVGGAVPLQGSKGWLCTFTDPANAVTVHLDVAVDTVQRQRTGFDAQTASGGSVLDPAVHLGERAAWGAVPSGRTCDLMVLDSNATFRTGIDDEKAATADAGTCKDRVKAIAQALYDAMQPR